MITKTPDIQSIARDAARKFAHEAYAESSYERAVLHKMAAAVAVAVLKHALALDEDDTKDRPPSNVILAELIDQFEPQTFAAQTPEPEPEIDVEIKLERLMHWQRGALDASTGQPCEKWESDAYKEAWAWFHNNETANIMAQRIGAIAARASKCEAALTAPRCDCGAAMTQCTDCAIGEWQAAHPNCRECCPVSPAPPVGTEPRLNALAAEIELALDWIARESFIVDYSVIGRGAGGLGAVVELSSAKHAILFIRRVLRGSHGNQPLSEASPSAQSAAPSSSPAPELAQLTHDVATHLVTQAKPLSPDFAAVIHEQFDSLVSPVPSNVVHVPDVPGPKGVCWQTGPIGTVEFFHRCTFQKGHDGPHQWEPAVSPAPQGLPTIEDMAGAIQDITADALAAVRADALREKKEPT